MKTLKNLFVKVGAVWVIILGIVGNLGLVFSLTVDKNILDVVAYIKTMILTSNGMPDGEVGVKLNEPQGEIWVRNKIKTPGNLEAGGIEAATVNGSVIRVSDGGRLEIPPGALSDGSVLEADLATGAVSTRVLADGSVTQQKLASGINLGYWEQVSGGIAYSSGDVFVGDVKIASSGLSQNLNSDMVDGLHATDILAMGSTSSAGGEFITLYRLPAEGGAERSDPGVVNCPAGYTLVYRGGYGYYSAASSATRSPNGGCIKGLTPMYYSDGGTSLGCKLCKKAGEFSEITVFWKTKNSYDGDLGGRAGADAKCQSEIPTYLQGKITNVHAVVNVTEADEIIDYLDADPDDDGVARGEFPVEAPIYYFDSAWSKFNIIYGSWKEAIADVNGSTLNDSYIIGIGSVGPIDRAGLDRRGEGIAYDTSYRSYNCGGWTRSRSVGAVGEVFYDTYVATCDDSLPLLCMGVMPANFIKW